MPGLPNINTTAWPSQSSGDFEQFQGFGSTTVLDDFGDFQQIPNVQLSKSKPVQILTSTLDAQQGLSKPALSTPVLQQSDVSQKNANDVLSQDDTSVEQAVSTGHIGSKVLVTNSLSKPEDRINGLYDDFIHYCNAL